MTRTHLYVAVICLGAGLFAGVSLRRDPELSPIIEPTPQKTKEYTISLRTDPSIGSSLVWCTGEEENRHWYYSFNDQQLTNKAKNDVLKMLSEQAR